VRSSVRVFVIIPLNSAHLHKVQQSALFFVDPGAIVTS
jgi:hypothetical protein